MATKKARAKVSKDVVEKRETLLDDGMIQGPSGDGFKDVSGSRVTGWFLHAAGNVLQGVMKDFFEVESSFNRKGEEPKMKKVYKIELTAVDSQWPTIVIPADSDDEEELRNGVPANVGDVVGLDEKGFLKSLSKCVVGQEVWVACMGKMSSSAEYPQGAWKYKVKAKPVAADLMTGEVSSAAAEKSK